MTVRRSNRPLPARQRGAVMVLAVLALLSILLMAALALDGSHMLLNKTRLQNAVDAAALSGAKTLQQVLGSGNSATLSRDAALATLRLNAQAPGNAELNSALGTGGASFARVELAASVYGPFSFPGPLNARYVRVSVPNYGLVGFFWRIMDMFGTAPGKTIAAVATAGPSPTNPCDIAPMMVCGNPDQYNAANELFWGYRFGDLQVLKGASNNDPVIGPGNFQLIRLGGASGASDMRDALAGGIERCNVVGDTVPTEPGNNVGPVAQGLNTRFGVYDGPISSKSASYPPDQVISFSTPRMTFNSNVTPPRAEYQNQPVQSRNGDLYTTSHALLDFNDWQRSVANCPNGCQANGVFERRVLKIVVGNCNGASGGSTSVPVLGFGCFFLVQSLPGGQGNQAVVFGQFIRECEGDNVPGPNSVGETGPQIIQLYKTYIDNSRTPSSDS